MTSEDRCGDSAVPGNKEGHSITACQNCIHWFQPEDGLKPGARWGQTREWWTEAGLCTRHAPSPGTDEKRHVFWPVTHADDGCGDGETMPDEVDGDERPQAPIYHPPPEVDGHAAHTEHVPAVGTL